MDKTDEEVRGASVHDGCVGDKVLIVFFSPFGSKDEHVDEVSLVRVREGQVRTGPVRPTDQFYWFTAVKK